MVDMKKVKGKWISRRSWKTKEAAEKARKNMPLANHFKTTRSRSDKRYRIKVD